MRFWLKLGFISFGGPAGQIAIMHQEVVVKRRWVSEERFLHALDYRRLRRVKLLSAALGAVTAAVVGVILNLALWFGGHSLVPDGKSVDWFSLILAVGAFVALKRFKIGMFTVIAVCALAEVLRMLLFVP